MTVPTYLAAFVDDAAIFPPGNAPLEQAVSDHVAHRDEPHAELVGGFVVSDVKLPDLQEVVEQRAQRAISGDHTPLEVNVVVTGGAGAVEPAVVWASRAEHLTLRGLEFALRDEDDLAHNARRFVSVVDSLGETLDDVTVYAE